MIACSVCKIEIDRAYCTMCSKCYQRKKAEKLIEARTYVKMCPVCNTETVYAGKQAYLASIKNNTMCRRCASSKNIKKYADANDGFKGSNNPFYGKKHSVDVITKLKNRDTSYTQTEKFRQDASIRFKKLFKDPEMISKCNCFANKTESQVDEIKKKMSMACSGSKNGMYGRPSPMGSGNGWSGWYNGLYFRSILELSYIKYLIDNNIKFEIAEKKKYAIEYIDSYNKRLRNYFPDFYLVENDQIIEIKPKKLINTQQNQDKYKAARSKHGDKFVVLTEYDLTVLSDDEINSLYESKKLIWLKKYEDKFLKRRGF